MSYNTPEGRVKKRGRDMCRDLGIYFFPVQQGGTSLAGIPDDVLCVSGRFVHIEYKVEMRWDKVSPTTIKTLPTDMQCKRMEQCRACNGITLVVDRNNIDRLELDLCTIRDATLGAYILHCGWKWELISYMQYKSGALHIKVHPDAKTIPHPKNITPYWTF